MPGLVSICFLTYNRPRLAVEALRSCLEQTYRDIEVIIGDDTRNDSVEQALAPLLSDSRVRYSRNPQCLGQAENVNVLFDRARGERLLLLHDDDLLLPDAVAAMERCWAEQPALLACYGKQSVITHSGSELPDRTAEFDRRFHRTSDRAGLQKSKLWAALVEQMPPDGAMMRTDAARVTRFRSYEEVGDDCDYDFILRLVERPGDFFLLDRYITRYRLTDESVSSRKTIDHIFRLSSELTLPPELEETRRSLLRDRAAYAVHCHLLCGRRADALKIIRNAEYWPDGALSKGRLRAFVFALAPASLYRGLRDLRSALGMLIRRNDFVYGLVNRARK